MNQLEYEEESIVSNIFQISSSSLRSRASHCHRCLIPPLKTFCQSLFFLILCIGMFRVLKLIVAMVMMMMMLMVIMLMDAMMMMTM